MKRYWLTPQKVYRQLDEEFGPLIDVCPFPRPVGFNALEMGWSRERVNYCNPPFCKRDGVDGKGPIAFVRKALEEQQRGCTSIIALPVYHAINLLIEGGAELRSLGRVRWIEVDSGEPWQGAHPTLIAILRGKQ